MLKHTTRDNRSFRTCWELFKLQNEVDICFLWKYPEVVDMNGGRDELFKFGSTFDDPVI
jgi:hypothetical protein